MHSQSSNLHPMHSGQPPPTGFSNVKAPSFTPIRTKWNSNTEIAQILYSVQNRPELLNHLIERPASGTQALFRKYDGTWFKADGFEWKRRREGRLVREDHMKLKVNKQELISANYAHSAVVPTFHRRVYWLTSHPDVVLVHYLNSVTDGENDLNSWTEKIYSCLLSNGLILGEDQLIAQLAPIFSGMFAMQEIVTLCRSILQLKHQAASAQRLHASLPMQNGEGSEQQQSQSGMCQLERRNSCSSAFRRGLSSMALRRQPSTFSDSIDANYIERVNGGGHPVNSHAMYSNPAVDQSSARLVPADDRSHSAETQRSSNRDEDLSGTGNNAHSGAASSSSFMQEASRQIANSLPEILDIAPMSASMKGGSRALVIGEWYLKGHEYAVVFGRRKVAAQLMRPGVLAVSIPPADSSCTVSVYVVCNDVVASKNFRFVYEEDVQRVSNWQSLIDRLHVIASAFGAHDLVKKEPSSRDEESTVSILRLIRTARLQYPQLLSAPTSLPCRTILHAAASMDHGRVIEEILSWRRQMICREFDPLARDAEGMTPLHVAAKMGNVQAAKALVEQCDSSVDVLDDRGRTPWDMAADEPTARITNRTSDRDTEETIGKEAEEDAAGHHRSTALWVLTDGETVTDEHLLRHRGRVNDLESVADTEMLADDMPQQTPNAETGWHKEPLHVEISMDTDVHVPDSPKMAEIFNAVTSPGVPLTENTRQKMFSLAKQIIDALPARIKLREDDSLLDEDNLTVEAATAFTFSDADNLSHMIGSAMNQPRAREDYWHPQQQQPNMFGYQNEGDGRSSVSGLPSVPSSFDNHHLYPNKDGTSGSFASSRENTFESSSFEFDNSRDLGEFFSLGVEGEIDPIQQRLGDLKLSDGEQREVFEAARLIQRAYREYRMRNNSRRQLEVDLEKERRAAITIQCCYRRYRQFCYFKKLHSAAIVVQKHFRLKKVNQLHQHEDHSSSTVSDVPEHPTLDGQSIRIQVPQNSSCLLREHRAATTIQLAYRGHRKRQAAARKIQKFMKESRQKLRRIQQEAQSDVDVPPPSSPRELQNMDSDEQSVLVDGCTLGNHNLNGLTMVRPQTVGRRTPQNLNLINTGMFRRLGQKAYRTESPSQLSNVTECSIPITDSECSLPFIDTTEDNISLVTLAIDDLPTLEQDGNSDKEVQRVEQQRVVDRSELAVFAASVCRRLDTIVHLVQDFTSDAMGLRESTDLLLSELRTKVRPYLISLDLEMCLLEALLRYNIDNANIDEKRIDWLLEYTKYQKEMRRVLEVLASSVYEDLENCLELRVKGLIAHRPQTETVEHLRGMGEGVRRAVHILCNPRASA